MFNKQKVVFCCLFFVILLIAATLAHTHTQANTTLPHTDAVPIFLHKKVRFLV